MTEDHRHEVGEDRGGCANCALAEKVAAMSEFEAACLTWYFETVNDFSIGAGIVADCFRDLGLGVKAKRFFLKAQEIINQSQVRIGRERAEIEAEQMENDNRGH